MSVALNITSAILSATSFTFFLVGVIGYSNENTTVQNTNWFHRYGTGSAENQNYFVGLERIVFQNGGLTQGFVYADLDCGDLCNVCERQGENAFALLVIAVIFAFITMALSTASAIAPMSQISGANIATSFVSTLFGVIGWSLFVNKCFHKIVRSIDGDFDYGPGAILSLIAFLLMFIVFVLQIAATALSAPAPAPAAAPKSEPVPTNEL